MQNLREIRKYCRGAHCAPFQINIIIVPNFKIMMKKEAKMKEKIKEYIIKNLKWIICIIKHSDMLYWNKQNLSRCALYK